MCGLFGVARATSDPCPERAAGVLATLGRLAERRGTDAAGFALASQEGGCQVVKATGPFTTLWQPARHVAAAHQARVALGHTRHASQGAADRLANAAPLEAGRLVGAVNGDIDADGLRGLVEPQGETDSERLLLALDRVRGELRRVVGVLAAMRGLAALAWVDDRHFVLDDLLRMRSAIQVDAYRTRCLTRFYRGAPLHPGTATRVTARGRRLLSSTSGITSARSRSGGQDVRTSGNSRTGPAG